MIEVRNNLLAQGIILEDIAGEKTILENVTLNSENFNFLSAKTFKKFDFSISISTSNSISKIFSLIWF